MTSSDKARYGTRTHADMDAMFDARQRVTVRCALCAYTLADVPVLEGHKRLVRHRERRHKIAAPAKRHLSTRNTYYTRREFLEQVEIDAREAMRNARYARDVARIA